MPGRLRRGPAAVLCGVLLALAFSASSLAYDYPYTDPYLATVLGAGLDARKLPRPRVSVHRIRPYPERYVPSVFWHGNALRFGLAKQRGVAPLVFVLGGTGSTFQAASVQSLRDVFFEAGFHVLSLSSPTTPEFITAASGSSRPGIPAEDARDLHAVMRQAMDKIGDKIEVSDFYLVGYSMGALHAAFVGALDAELRRFNFRRILMINPPVSLYDSAARLDALVRERLPGGITNAGPFLEQIFGRYAGLFQQIGGAEIDNEFLYLLQQRDPLSDDQLAALIGLVFRISASNMAFTADAMAHTGQIVPAGETLSSRDTMTGYFKRSLHWGLVDYFDRLLLPHWRAAHATATPQDLRYAMGLQSIADYLETSDTVGVMTNRDDLILDAKDLEFLQRTFGSRCTIYPHGGHGGNLDYGENQREMLRFFGVVQDAKAPGS